ncbi:hypothetical protein [Streptomyces tagetis]|uniref:Uncharacterized protein n=1 Tax=Streptomyces tagetis TaxID=2820809 RepID=A0A941B2E7_9ACTN|nr:hypothetical protein [Streptomyces sp. RG38]MBQ0827142.1 hypothetical protein [Streptomyces sp. RG38]
MSVQGMRRGAAGDRRAASFARFSPGDSGKPDTAVPHLYIPYHEDDDGDRPQPDPFPPGVLSYWCEGIGIFLPDGSPYTGGEIPRRPASTVLVDVVNSGDRDASAQVGLYWCDPAAGFGAANLRRAPVLGSAVTVPVQAKSRATAPPVPLLPGDVAPGHMCLLAVVSDLYDAPSGSWNPLADRHYAQHNLSVVPVTPDGTGAVTFQAVNPFPDLAALVEVSVRPASREEATTLTGRLHARAREVDADALRLLAAGEDREPSPALRFTLDGGESRSCQALLWAESLAPDEFTAVQVETRARPLDGARTPPRLGSFGAVFFSRR